MSHPVSTFSERVQYFLRGIGAAKTFRLFARKVISPLYERDAVHMAVLHLFEGDDSPERIREREEQGYSGTVFERAEELDALGACEYDGKVRAALKKFLDGGSDRVAAVVLRREPDGGGHGVIGFIMLDCSLFWYWLRKLEGELPDDAVYMDEIFMMPEYRGSRITKATRPAMRAYFRDRGVTKAVAFIKTHNTPSLKAILHTTEGCSGSLSGTFYRTRLLGGIIDRITPPEAVRGSIEASYPGQDDAAAIR